MVAKESKLISDRYFRQRNGKLRGQGSRMKPFDASVYCLVCFVAYCRIILLWLQNADFCDAFEVHQNH